MSSNILNTDQKIILLTSTIHINDDDILVLKDLLTSQPNWSFIKEFSEAQGTAPLLYKSLKKNNLDSLVPDDVISFFQNIYFFTQTQNLLALNELKKVLAAFNKEGIKTILLKGMSSAEFIYKDQGLRPMGDVDILVEQERLLDAEKILFNLGFINTAPYKSYKLRTLNIHNHLNAFRNKHIIIELHRDLSSVHHIYRIPIADVFKNAEEKSIENEKIHILGLQNNLQYLSIHAIQHFLKKKIRLNSFVDISELITLNLNRIDWPSFINDCSKYGITLPVFRALSLCKIYLNTPVPDNVFELMNKGEDNLEAEFMHLLNNRTDRIRFKTPSSYIKKIAKIEGFTNKVRYLWTEIFPSKEYMVYTYKLKNDKFYFMYYFVQFGKQTGKTIRNVFLLSKRIWAK